MLVPKDFATQVSALAESTPREAIANLLSALLPRVVAKTRPPQLVKADFEYDARSPYAKHMAENTYDPMSKLTRSRRAPRTRMPRHRVYRVLYAQAKHNHRARTWTRAMVDAITSSTSEAGAAAFLQEVYPQYADRHPDIPWCVEKGYITFEPEGE